MMREMEKAFENLKEEFQRKISSESSFISYFVNRGAESESMSPSDSYEEISMEESERDSFQDDSAIAESPEAYTDTENQQTVVLREDDPIPKIVDIPEDGLPPHKVHQTIITLGLKIIYNNGNKGLGIDSAETKGDLNVNDLADDDQIVKGHSKEDLDDSIGNVLQESEQGPTNDAIQCRASNEEVVEKVEQQWSNNNADHIIGRIDLSNEKEKVNEDHKINNDINEEPKENVETFNERHSSEIIKITCESEEKRTEGDDRKALIKLQEEELTKESVNVVVVDDDERMHLNSAIEEDFKTTTSDFLELKERSFTTTHDPVIESPRPLDPPEIKLNHSVPVVEVEMRRNQKIRRQVGESVPERRTAKVIFPRIMWSEMPEVVNSGILKTLPKKLIQLQEAMFEIITSEASYYQSLMILTTHFFESDLFKVHENKDSLTSSLEKHHIFSNLILIMATSEKFLDDLDQRWHNEKPLITQIADIILKHASGPDFQNYVTYLRNQEYQSKALKRLTENDTFRQQLTKLENSSVCGKLSMDSYLMLPMQRLTRLKLLLDTLLKIMSSEELKDFVKEEHINTAELTIEKLKMLLDASDSQKGLMDQKSTLISLMTKMEFPQNFKRITVSDKVFLKEGELRVHQQNPLKFVRKFSKKRQPMISLILFNDLLIVAKKKGLRLLVIDYCDRVNIVVTETKYKAIISSADVSINRSSVDLDECENERKTSITSLARSKTTLSPEEWKRFSTSVTNTFKSMPMISRNEEQEIINNSFTLKFTKSQTDIFSIAMVLLAKSRADRDEWMALLSDPNLGDNVTGTFTSNEGKLHKSTSLRSGSSRKDVFGMNKTQSLYAKRKDEILEQIFAQREIAQDCSPDDFMTIKYDCQITLDK